MQHGRACCRYDQLSHDVLHNRILRSTMEAWRLTRPLTRNSLTGSEALRWFAGVERVSLTPGAFRKLQLHRNNAVYGFLLSICRLSYWSSCSFRSARGNRFSGISCAAIGKCGVCLSNSSAISMTSN